ncbi:MAG: sel1 repeat family protein, partial [Campylobacter sp.]|nr:sel1 repeat family protein [Campylobacter sp.]
MKKIILTIMIAFSSLFGVDLQTLVDECKNDNFTSCSDVGTVLYQAGELETAAQFWQKACDGKNHSGCQNLGVLYHLGQGVEKDSKKAETYTDTPLSELRQNKEDAYFERIAKKIGKGQ